MARPLFLCLGCVMVGLGIVGAMLPLMPTTVFLILAAACFARSSPALERWLLEHPRFGASLCAWREQRAIPRQAKCMACLGMTIGFILFLTGAHPDAWVAVCVAALLLASALYVVSRPRSSLRDNRTTPHAERQ